MDIPVIVAVICVPAWIGMLADTAREVVKETQEVKEEQQQELPEKETA